MSTESKLKHLELIQSVISRMAANLFFLKGWAISLLVAIFALAAKDANPKYIVVAFAPAAIFWMLDGYFLSQERQYRALYDHVRQLPAAQVDFSMNTEPFATHPRNRWMVAMFAPTLLLFYGSLLLLMLFVFWYVR